jgi:hypothetical protein
VQDQIAQTTASTTTSTTTTAPVDPAAGLVPPPTLAPSQG